MITLEKIDQIVERTGVTYANAKIALEEAQGDVLEAIIYLENNATTFSDKISQNVNLKKEEVLGTLKELINKGNVTKVIIEKENKKYLEVPVNVALSAAGVSVLIGAIMLPIAGIIGTGLYIGNFKIKVVKDDGTEVDVNEETEKKILLLKGKVEDLAENFDQKIKNNVSDESNMKDKNEEEFIDLNKKEEKSSSSESDPKHKDN